MGKPDHFKEIDSCQTCVFSKYEYNYCLACERHEFEICDYDCLQTHICDDFEKADLIEV